MTDWPANIMELADHLKLGRFGVLGVSGGGPYAAACAARIPERLRSVALVCSVGPMDTPDALGQMAPLYRWLVTFARAAPWLAEQTAALCLKAFWGKGEQVIPRQVEERLPPADRAVLANPELRATLIAASAEAFRQGVTGAAWDGLLLSRPWGFDLTAIRLPVRLWHGERDTVVPVAMGRGLAQGIPACQATFLPEEGHFSLPYGRMDQILAMMLEQAG
jgi:pimeloyl-ACP methyl ester carboxylesterase